MTSQLYPGLRTEPHEVSTGGKGSRAMRILQVTPRFLPYSGGVESHVYQVASRLSREGHQVTILTTDTTGQLATREDMDGFTIRRVPAWPPERDLYWAPRLTNVIRQEPWDVVHVQSYHTFVAPLAMWAAARARRPYVVTFHGGGHSSTLRNAIRGSQVRLLKPLLARASRIVAVAAFEIDLYGRRLGIPSSRFRLIPNGCDLPAGRAPAGMSAPTDEHLILSIGRLERYKGHHRILQAMPHIVERDPSARLRIVGAGPFEATLRRLTDQLGLNDRVTIGAIAPTEREAMARLISRAALVVLLSEYETHPIAVLEALSCGRPCVVADTSGMRELAERGLARAVAVNSKPDQIAQAVIETLARPQLVSPIALPTWDDCSHGLEALYQEVLAEAACAS